MMKNRDKPYSIEISPEAQADIEQMSPEDRIKLYRVLEAIRLDPHGMGEPITPENCDHDIPRFRQPDGTCGLCGGPWPAEA